jgi:hypothetical protein
MKIANRANNAQRRINSRSSRLTQKIVWDKQWKKDEKLHYLRVFNPKNCGDEKSAALKGAPEQQQFHFWFAVTVTECVTAAVSGTAARQKKQHSRALSPDEFLPVRRRRRRRRRAAESEAGGGDDGGLGARFQGRITTERPQLSSLARARPLVLSLSLATYSSPPASALPQSPFACCRLR